MFSPVFILSILCIFFSFQLIFLSSYLQRKNDKKPIGIVECFEHFFEPSPNELAVFKLVAKLLQESNLKGIGIFMSNITVITLNKFRKRVRGLLRTHISSIIEVSGISSLP